MCARARACARIQTFVFMSVPDKIQSRQMLSGQSFIKLKAAPNNTVQIRVTLCIVCPLACMSYRKVI